MNISPASSFKDLSFESWRGERPVGTTDRALPLDRRMALLRAAMTRMLRQTPPQATYSFMMLGYPELFDRMPALLANSKCWNAHGGYGVPDTSTCVRNTLNAGNAYRELSITMRQLGYSVTIDSGPEEVLAMPVTQLFPEQRKLLAPLREAHRLLSAVRGSRHDLEEPSPMTAHAPPADDLQPARLPSFDLMVRAYIHDASTDVPKQMIGGHVNAPWILDTCAIRMSRTLNYSHFPIPGPGHSAMHVLSGADRLWYAYRMAELKAWLRQQLGPPQIDWKKPDITMAKFAGHKGIIALDIHYSLRPGETLAVSGHIELWDGKQFAGEYSQRPQQADDFAVATQIWLWIAPN